MGPRALIFKFKLFHVASAARAGVNCVLYISSQYSTFFIRFLMWPFSSAYPEVRIGDILDEYDYIIVGKYTAAFIGRLSNFR